MQNVNAQVMEHGFLAIPKLLIKQFLTKPLRQEGELEAFLKMLLKVNYSEMSCDCYGRQAFLCKRGESMYSYRKWSEIFHWTLSRTFRFIRQLCKDGILELIPHSGHAILHIRIINYELWAGNSSSTKKAKKPVNEKFYLFWDQYHETTLLPKENIAKAQREWKKLSEKEQQLAIDRIEDYYYHLANTKFMLHACSYLANKAFLNEY